VRAGYEQRLFRLTVGVLMCRLIMEQQTLLYTGVPWWHCSGYVPSGGVSVRVCVRLGMRCDSHARGEAGDGTLSPT
jgi:hypothetical protein